MGNGGQFVEVCRRGLKFNAGKSKVMVINGEEELECKFYIDGITLEQVSKFKYLGYVLDKSGIVNARDLQLECASLA